LGEQDKQNDDDPAEEQPSQSCRIAPAHSMTGQKMRIEIVSELPTLRAAPDQAYAVLLPPGACCAAMA
jgi:hypothetical protein